jgi:tetratricopeptide (TPR) repeat protein
MSAPAALTTLLPVTSGDLAVNNLTSSLDAAWAVWRRWPERHGIAQRIVAEEQLRGQFCGDTAMLDRLEVLAEGLTGSIADRTENHLPLAQIAAAGHRFSIAREHLREAEAAGVADVDRARLAIAQACGDSLGAVLEERKRRVAIDPRLEELVPLGALLADLGHFELADETYQSALQAFSDVSPFGPAWVCFQMGRLWGETVPDPQQERAASWYEAALDYLPDYVTARIHLAEIKLQLGNAADAEQLLRASADAGHPEALWRLADVAAHRHDDNEAVGLIGSATREFEALLVRHELAFADHAAEFYLAAGANPPRALTLARANLENRPTLAAFELAHEAALVCKHTALASALAHEARVDWSRLPHFERSSVARDLP